MTSDLKDLIIDEGLLFELVGWNEIRFNGPFGGKLSDSESRSVRSNCLKTLREKPPRWFREGFYKDLRYDLQEDHASSRSPEDTPLSSPTLRHLILEVDTYNNTINNVYVLDQLKEAGNTVDLSDRPKFLKALSLAKGDLILALKTEKILRRNPKFMPGKFSDSIASIKALEVSSQAGSYSKYFNEIAQVAISVQKELKTIFQEVR